MTFTQDEINLMCLYDTSDKAQILTGLRLALPYIEDAEIINTANTVISKLERMSSNEFSRLDLVPTAMAEDLING